MDATTCKDKDDIIKFMVSRMTWISDPPVIEGWHQQFGYRQNYWIQQIWYHPKTGRYAFHSDEFDNWNPNTIPNLGMYDSFHDLLDGVAKRYTKLWKIDNETTV